MIDHGKKNLLGVLVDAIDYEAVTARVLWAARTRHPLAVSALAVHGVMTGVKDPYHRHRLNRLDLVVPDGQPVRWALNWLYGTALPDRVYGPSLMLRLCQLAAQQSLPIYLFGDTAHTLTALSRNLTRRFPGLTIAGSRASRFRSLSTEEQARTAEAIRASGAAMVFVGLGCPRQEVWVFENRTALDMPLIAVGAAFPIHAGLRAQAPSWMQRRGLEWCFRLLQEPRRLWRRYLLLNPQFILLLARQALGWSGIDDGIPPTTELRYG